MALSSDIQVLRVATLDALDSAYDYYWHDRGLWRLFQIDVEREGRTVTVRNRDTGNKANEQDLIRLAQSYVIEHLAAFTLEQFVSIFETFFFDLLQVWLQAHPQGLTKTQIDIADIFTLPDKQAIVQLVVNKEIDAIRYKRLADWFKTLNKLVNLGCPTDDEVERLAEIKASRDLLMHNKGMANAIYCDKARSKARFAVGQKIDVPQAYLRESWALIKKVVADVATAAANKA
jgi:hypothetical protein